MKDQGSVEYLLSFKSYRINSKMYSHSFAGSIIDHELSRIDKIPNKRLQGMVLVWIAIATVSHALSSLVSSNCFQINRPGFFIFNSTGTKPRFPDKPKIRQAGKSVIFEVLLEADPAPDLRWSKAGQEIKTGGRYKCDCKTTGIQHLISLEISQVTADDGGEYLVNAKNKLGDSTATINLNIGAPKQ